MVLPRPSHQRSRLYALAAAGLMILCGLRIVAVISYAADLLPLAGDARAYLAAARAVLAGASPVGPGGAQFLPEAGAGVPLYLYPPLLAIVLVPLALVPYPASLYLWLALVAAATLLLIPALRPLVGWRVAAVGVLFFLPTWESLWLASINALIALLLAVALSAADRGRERALGVALALGTLLKITPVLGAPVLLAHGRWRGLAAMALTMGGAVLLSLPFVGLADWLGGSLYALRSTETNPYLLSWTALLRGQGGPLSVVGPPALTFGMLALTLLRLRAVSLPLGLAAMMLLPLLVAGIIWHYTALLALPALAVLWRHSARARLIALTTWAGITLIGGALMPLTLTLCWCACCWPQLLGPEEAPQGATA